MGVSIGIDVSKQHLDWASASEAQSARVRKTAAGIRLLVARLVQEAGLDRIVVESTGGYERALIDALFPASGPASPVHSSSTCPNSEPWVAARSLPWLASHPSPTTAGKRPGTGGSAQAAPGPEPPSTWRR